MKDKMIMLLTGFLMGIANMVSGAGIANVAVATRSYKGMAEAFANIREFFKPCIRYLLPLIAGFAVALAFCLTAGKSLYAAYPTAFRFFFMGMMFGTLPGLLKKTPKNNIKYWIIYPVVIGLAMTLVLGFYEPTAHEVIGTRFDPKKFFMVFGAAAFGSASIFFPGVHPISFVYGFHADGLFSLIATNAGYLLPVFCGCACGFMGMGWVITWLYRTRPIAVYAFIYASYLGALRVQIGKINGAGDIAMGLVFALVGGLLGYVLSKENRSPEFNFTQTKEHFQYDFREMDDDSSVVVVAHSEDEAPETEPLGTIEAVEEIVADTPPEEQPIEKEEKALTAEEKKALKKEKYGKHIHKH